MLSSFPISVALGTILGFLSGLGVGGGSLLILWITLALNMDPATARPVNLLFFLPSALVASFFRWKQGHLQIKKILPAILAGSITAGIFSFFSQAWDVAFLKKAFGILLLFTGIRELFYKPKENQQKT